MWSSVRWHTSAWSSRNQEWVMNQFLITYLQSCLHTYSVPNWFSHVYTCILHWNLLISSPVQHHCDNSIYHDCCMRKATHSLTCCTQLSTITRWFYADLSTIHPIACSLVPAIRRSVWKHWGQMWQNWLESTTMMLLQSHRGTYMHVLQCSLPYPGIRLSICVIRMWCV